MDWLLSGALNLTVVGLIALSSTGSLLAGYCGLLQLLQGRTTTGLTDLAICCASALASWLMIQNRNDLVDR